MENNQDINITIGKNLLALRKAKKLTQLELAEKFNYSDKSISKWESGDSLPSVDILYELAKFYGTTLDALTSTEPIEPKISAEKTKHSPAKIIITLLAMSAVWLCATVLFVCLNIIREINYGLIFVWAIPASAIIFIIFNSVWGKPIYLVPALTVLIWTTLASIHLQLIKYDIWIIYILGIPLQVAVILWGALLKKNKDKKIKKTKKKKESTEEADVSKDKADLE